MSFDKSKLTDEFLSTLFEVTKEIGHGVDFVASAEFVQEVHRLANKEAPSDKDFGFEME